jgi:ureidoacrylate peracid hydrolase
MPAMHKIAIPQSVIESVIRSRGREHIYDTLDPAKTALLVVDMQNGFMMEGVAHSLCREAVDIVPNINRIAAALRRSGGTVVWIQNAVTDETLESWSIRVEMDGPKRTATRVQSMAPGTKGHALWAALETQPDDLFVQKTRFSAFIQGSSDLEAQLRSRGIDTVIVTGTVTNICCESTARDAMMRNFRTIMVTDGNAAMSDDMHNASLAAFYVRFGDIMSTDHLIGVLDANASVRTAAQ